MFLDFQYINRTMLPCVEDNTEICKFKYLFFGEGSDLASCFGWDFGDTTLYLDPFDVLDMMDDENFGWDDLDDDDKQLVKEFKVTLSTLTDKEMNKGDWYFEFH